MSGRKGASRIQAYHGDLINYRTGEVIRAATLRERKASERAAEDDGGTGVIVVDDVACFVGLAGTPEPDPEPEVEPEPEPAKPSPAPGPAKKGRGKK